MLETADACDWVTAMASVVAAACALVALVKAIEEIDAWKTRRRTEKEAEVAGCVLGALMRFLGTLREIALTSRWASSSEQREWRHVWAEDIDSRWQAFAVTRLEFINASDEARVYLDEVVVALLDEAWLRMACLQAQHQTIGITLRQGWDDEAMFKTAFGDEVRAELLALLVKGDRLLKPIAQLRERRVTT